MNSIPLTPSFENVKTIYDFAKLAGELKSLKRTGWTHFPGIKEVESVADHSWRMSLFCMLFAKDKTIDFERCIKFAIIHDLAEVIVGDITPRDGISEDQKHKMEDEGIKLLLSKLENQEIRDELYSIWRQYEDRKCPESKLVKDMDRFEMMQQAFEYEQKYPTVDLSEFFSDSSRITHPVIKSWLQELLEKREAFLKQQNPNKQNTHCEQEQQQQQ
ncbi:hypothetical protein ABPG74_018800 [Tetrahymena malaccensis]